MSVLVWSPLGKELFGVPWGFNFSFSTSIPISVIGESPQGTILGERLSEMVFIKNLKLEIPIINF